VEVKLCGLKEQMGGRQVRFASQRLGWPTSSLLVFVKVSR